MSDPPEAKPLAVIVYDATLTADIADWLEALFLKELTAYRVKKVSVAEQKFLDTSIAALGGPFPPENPCPHSILITIFWDGQSDESKAVFTEFRGWAAAQPSVLLQALNSKKGTHSLLTNADAVMTTILKKVPPQFRPSSAETAPVGKSGAPAAKTATTAGTTPSSKEPGPGEATTGKSSTAGTTAGSTAGTAGSQTSLKPGAAEPEVIPTLTFDLTPDGMTRAIQHGQGETYWTISKPPPEFDATIAEMQKIAKALGVGVAPLCAPKDLVDDGVPVRAQEFILRRNRPESHIEMRIAMCGNVDSGKSTLTSVLTHGFKDDGRGFARAKVFVHKHEQDTGRTSSVTGNHLGFDAVGKVVNYPAGGPTSAKHNMTAQEMALQSAKIVTLYDLAGHEKYLKTTVLGMTRSMPDYACIVISANNGIQRMTKEHLGLCLALKLPFYIVVTRIDATPDNVRQETNATILKLLKMPTVKKLAYPVKKPEDVVVCAKNLKADRICPIFEVSNVTGQGIEDLTQFINLLPVRKDWTSLTTQPKEMIIDSTFFVTGVGTVVGGIITQGVFKINDNVMLGPDSNGQYRLTQIKSIHVKGVDVEQVEAGNDAALCVKKEKRSAIRKGMVLVDPASEPKSYWQFEAEIVILYHSTTISSDYEPVIHSQTVRQSARILLVDQEVLRTGDRATVRFQFLYRPEFMKIGHRLIFREGRTKGIGVVTRLIEGPVSHPLGDGRQKAKESVRQKHDKKGDS